MSVEQSKPDYRLSLDDASRYYDVLVELAGASEGSRIDFCRYMSEYDSFPKEWRFMGKLGMGGKARADSQGRRPRIDCYQEDMTPERREIIDAVNERLRVMFNA